MKKIWFKRKAYGWGWTPVTWQGWTITLGYLVIIGVIVNCTGYIAAVGDDMMHFFLLIILLTLIFVYVAYRTGESPRWQRGNKTSGKSKQKR